MIRVTFYNDFTNEEFTDNYDFGWVYESYYCLAISTEAICERYSLSDLVKIEKQVKDLTIIELENYVKIQCGEAVFKVSKLNKLNKIEIEFEHKGHFDFEYLDLDKYIDITEMVKRGIE